MRKKAKIKPVVMGICAAGSCQEPAEYKAPKSRFHTDEYQYLCLEHVREFNHAWDYFAGWSRKQIEDFMDDATRGHRPTWSMSANIAGGPPFFTSEALRDSFFEMMGEKPPKQANKKVASVMRKEREAFAILDMEPEEDGAKIKSQYKKLVKKYHPDVNKGDKTSEEMFKRVTNAYKMLMKTYGKKS